MLAAALRSADRSVALAMALGRWLVLPVSVLLFAQWPLRDVVRAYSLEANDLAQWMFALYVSLAMTFASREGTHLSAPGFAARYRPGVRAALGRFGPLACVAPWAVFLLVAASPVVWRSVVQLEAFPDSYNPGYSLVKASAWLLALLALLEAALEAMRPRR